MLWCGKDIIIGPHGLQKRSLRFRTTPDIHGKYKVVTLFKYHPRRGVEECRKSCNAVLTSMCECRSRHFDRTAKVLLGRILDAQQSRCGGRGGKKEPVRLTCRKLVS